jgi:hypothetical protein
MKQQKKFNSDQSQELTSQQQLSQNSVQEFSTVEELLRADAAQTSAPASIADRLQKSSAGFPKPNRSWWQRLFGQ